MRRLRKLINKYPCPSLQIATLGLTFVAPRPLSYFVSGLIWGYALFGFVDLMHMRKSVKRFRTRAEKDQYVIEKIFDAHKDELEKYQLVHHLDKSTWN